VHYKQIEKESGELKREFTLSPFVQQDANSQSFSANPSTKRLWDRDIFTHVSSVPIDTLIKNTQKAEIAVGDTMFTKRHIVVLSAMDSAAGPEKGQILIRAYLDVFDFDTSRSALSVTPSVLIDTAGKKLVSTFSDSLKAYAYGFHIEKLLPEKSGIMLRVEEADNNDRYIIMKAIEFPFINILWLGCVVMVIGFFFSIVRRVEENKKSSSRRVEEV
jgi:cytochrome c-type biogenesis protein CcmF